MKRRKGNALPIALMAVLLTTTVAYAGIAGQSAQSNTQEALSTSVVTDKDDVSEDAQNTASALSYDDILAAGVAAQFTGVDTSASKAAAASKTSASSVEEKLAEATEQEQQEQKEKEAEWEGRAIASNVEEYVYVRDAASTDSDVIGKLPRGGAGDVLEKGDEWTLLSSGEVEGYVSNDYLAFDAEALAVAEEVCSYVATVEIDGASIRSEADENAEVISTASTGDVLNVVETDDEWIKVETAECVGYLSGDIAHVELAVAEAEPVETEDETETASDEQAAETTNTETEDTAAADTSSAADTAEEASDTSSEEETDSAETSSAAVSSSSSAATSHSATFKVTAYCACTKCCGSYANGITATGTTATAGRTIAVDKSVIPLGTTVYINGVAYIAEDTGVYGNWIDLYMDSHDAALQWGVQYCTVTW